MKNLTQSLSGLASSLLLNVGLVQIAEKLEPMGSDQTHRVEDPKHCFTCGACNLPSRARR